jgi:hypothetical protein
MAEQFPKVKRDSVETANQRQRADRLACEGKIGLFFPGRNHPLTMGLV